MAKTTTWQIPYPDLANPADILGVDGVDDLAQRVDTLLTSLRASGSIPGEVKLWPGGVLPELATYGRWAWADGAAYLTATYPLASGHIDPAWRTFAGAADPGAGNFRVPDLRGVSPSGLDQMPGGARANRTTRAVAIVLAGRTGEETHVITLPEMAPHAHGVNDPGHTHNLVVQQIALNQGSTTYTFFPRDQPTPQGGLIYPNGTGITIQNAGGGGAHENMPPTVFVPYIVKLDD
jgi:microcystin-dependent protein